MVSWAWSAEMADLHEKCFTWFVQNFAEGQHGSLQVFGQDAQGEYLMVKLYAKEDAQMMADAQAQIEQLGFVRFIALGEGGMRAPEGVVSVFIMYFQDENDPRVRFAVTQYHAIEEGFSCGGWFEIDRFQESWLPKAES
jgi:hypothetical protein